MKIISFATNKGGVGKTACTFQIGCRLSMIGKKVLLVDMDGQASLTRSFGLDPEKLDVSIYDVLANRAPIETAIQQIGLIHLVPSQRKLSTQSAYLNDHAARQFLLLRALNRIKDQYDFILIDSPPSSDILSVNVICASDAVVGVAMPDPSSEHGIVDLIKFLNALKEIPNISPKLIGIIANGYDGRNRLDQQILERLQSLKSEDGISLIFETPIRYSVAIGESYAAKKSIYQYRPDSTSAQDFEKVTEEILARVQ